MTTELTFEEIYPNIVVYNNIFEDPERMYQIAKDSINNYEDAIWDKWNDWYSIGEKIENFGISFDKNVSDLKINFDIEPTSKVQEDQRYFMIELIKAFHLANNHYIEKHNFPIHKEEKDTVQSDGKKYQKWNWTGPSLCKYYVGSTAAGPDSERLAMRYHSDYVREAIKGPGYKFVLTTTIYLNDNYSGGGIDFAVGNKLINYKPKAGDFVVFPSGHPEYSTEDGEVYLHAAEICKENEKYFIRMFWTVYEDSSDEWKEKSLIFGDSWQSEMNKIQGQYEKENLQRITIDNGVRLR
jgi:hypothetical protein